MRRIALASATSKSLEYASGNLELERHGAAGPESVRTSANCAGNTLQYHTAALLFLYFTPLAAGLGAADNSNEDLQQLPHPQYAPTGTVAPEI